MLFSLVKVIWKHILILDNSERYPKIRTVLMWGIGSLADLRGIQPVFILCFLGLMKIKIFAGLFYFVLIALV